MSWSTTSYPSLAKSWCWVIRDSILRNSSRASSILQFLTSSSTLQSSSPTTILNFAMKASMKWSTSIWRILPKPVRVPICCVMRWSGRLTCIQGRGVGTINAIFAPSPTGYRRGMWVTKSIMNSSANIWYLFHRDFEKNAVFANRFKSTLFYSNWSPIAAYTDLKRQPHVLFTMKHDHHPQGEELLRGEALAITAAMVTRLERFRSEGHAFVPVRSYSLPFSVHSFWLTPFPISGPCLLLFRKLTGKGSPSILQRNKLGHF